MFRVFAAFALSILCSTSAGFAQDESQLSIELNRIGATSEDVCQVVFVGRNGLDQALEEVTLRLAVFDGGGVFQNMLALPLGQLASNKRRIVQFNLPIACSNISEIVVNDLASCKLGETSDDSDICQSKLAVSSRTDIAFGL